MPSICPFCKKTYKNYNSVHSHISLNHKKNKNIAPKITETEQKLPGIEQKTPEIEPAKIEIVPNNTPQEQTEPATSHITLTDNSNTDNNDGIEIDITELESLPSDFLNDYFKAKKLSPLTTDEHDRLTRHTGVMFKKRLPKIIYKYGDIVNVLLSGGKIVYKRVNQANEIVALRKKYQEDTEKRNKEMQQEVKKEVAAPVDEGYSGEALLALQKKYNLIKG